MATSTFVSVEAYLRSHHEPDAEYVDGEIEGRPFGEYDHVLWQKALIRWFLGHEATANVRVMFELRVQVTRTRSRVPDVLVLDRGWPREQIVSHAPLAVFEILSPEDSMATMLVKLIDYDAMGIEMIRVIDPKTQTIYSYAAGALEELDTEVADGKLKGLPIDWREIKTLPDQPGRPSLWTGGWVWSRGRLRLRVLLLAGWSLGALRWGRRFSPSACELA
jgi:Uma2 family endonuclease